MSLEADNVCEPPQALHTQTEGGNGMLSLRTRLCGADTLTQFTEGRIMTLQELLKGAATPVSADETGGL
ncbi:MAG: hypothetical protein AB7G75_29110 [Candidatus Binatia bacterium]